MPMLCPKAACMTEHKEQGLTRRGRTACTLHCHAPNMRLWDMHPTGQKCACQGRTCLHDPKGGGVVVPQGCRGIIDRVLPRAAGHSLPHRLSGPHAQAVLGVGCRGSERAGHEGVWVGEVGGSPGAVVIQPALLELARWQAHEFISACCARVHHPHAGAVGLAEPAAHLGW